MPKAIESPTAPVTVSGVAQVALVDTEVAKIPLVDWLDIVVPSTEYSYSFPVGTVRFTIKNEGSRTVRLGWNSGDTSIDGKFYNIEPGTSHTETYLGASITVFVSVPTSVAPAPQRLVILSWT